jgi:hypothetical protein
VLLDKTFFAEFDVYIVGYMAEVHTDVHESNAVSVCTRLKLVIFLTPARE